ncbi:hypothetical protein GGI07_000025 [Coemansia sp. Benny D115]|nr:hypothetical protein GGI07_000025 [Coemansia sp. Benny D115]
MSLSGETEAADRFRASTVKSIVREVLRTQLDGKKYDAEMSEEAKKISEVISSRLGGETGMERYKFVTNVALLEDAGQGAFMGASLSIDQETDGVAQESFVSNGIRCIATVYALYAEETLRKLESFIPVIVYYASKGNRKAPPGTTEFEKWRAVILRTEIILLEALCFDMVIDHPHVALIDIIHRLRPTQQLSQMAWNFIADFMRLPICLVYRPRTVALAAVALAVKVASVEMCKGLLDDSETSSCGRTSWMDRVGADRDQVNEVVQWLLDFYTREAQSRVTSTATQQQGNTAYGGGTEAAQTPASSPGSTTSPMSHHNIPQHQSPSS